MKGSPAQNKGQKALNSKNTAIPCVNATPTMYQIAALGTSCENGQEYWQVMFGNVRSVKCGHA
jgi:hypothetical protein